MSDDFAQGAMRAPASAPGLQDIPGGAASARRDRAEAYVNADKTPLGSDRGGVTFQGETHVRPALPEIERGVLWAVMDSPEPNAAIAVEMLTADAFDQFENRLVFEASAECVEAGEMPTLPAVCARLRSRGSDRAVTRAFEIADGDQRSLDVPFHAMLLLQQQMKRKQVDLASRIGSAALDPASDALELQDALEQSAFGIMPDIARKHVVAAADVTGDVLDQYRANADDDTGLIGIPTGYALLDKRTRGFRGSKTYLALAAPGMGKTIFGSGAALNASVRHGIGTAYFSTEMPGVELMDRMMCAEAGVSAEAAGEGTLIGADWKALEGAKGRLDAAPLFIDSTPRMHIDKIESQIRRLVRFKGVRFAVIDYLQKISYEGRAANYERGISYISGRLKSLALELDVPILILSQITREKAKEGKEPGKHDARGSGDVENDADVILTIYRPEEVGVEFSERHGMLTASLVIIGMPKCRNGRAFSSVKGSAERVLATFNRTCVRFDDCLPDTAANRSLVIDPSEDTPF